MVWGGYLRCCGLGSFQAAVEWSILRSKLELFVSGSVREHHRDAVEVTTYIIGRLRWESCQSGGGLSRAYSCEYCMSEPNGARKGTMLMKTIGAWRH